MARVLILFFVARSAFIIGFPPLFHFLVLVNKTAKLLQSLSAWGFET